jgi:hypothetical protein
MLFMIGSLFLKFPVKYRPDLLLPQTVTDLSKCEIYQKDQ